MSGDIYFERGLLLDRIDACCPAWSIRPSLVQAPIELALCRVSLFKKGDWHFLDPATSTLFLSSRPRLRSLAITLVRLYRAFSGPRELVCRWKFGIVRMVVSHFQVSL